MLLDNSKVNGYFGNILALKSCYRAFFPHTVPEWNHLPPNIRSASSVDCYKPGGGEEGGGGGKGALGLIFTGPLGAPTHFSLFCGQL